MYINLALKKGCVRKTKIQGSVSLIKLVGLILNVRTLILEILNKLELVFMKHYALNFLTLTLLAPNSVWNILRTRLRC